MDNLKSKASKKKIDELKTVPVDLKEVNNVVDKDVD